EVRHHPACVHRVPGETAAELVVHAAPGHGVCGAGRHRQRPAAGPGGVTALPGALTALPGAVTALPGALAVLPGALAALPAGPPLGAAARGPQRPPRAAPR